MNITYDLIKALIVRAEAEGSKMNCEFRIPGTAETIVSSAGIKREKSMAGEIQKRITRTVSNRARTSVSRMVRGILGGGMLGSIGSQVVNSSSRSLLQDVVQGYSSSEKENAIVEAFKKVAATFSYDDVLGWQKANFRNPETIKTPTKSKTSSQPTTKTLSEFEQLIIKNPITNSFDKEVLARMLLTIAQADGGISNDEEIFLKEFIPNYDKVLQKPPLSPIECEEVSKNAKATIYLLAWVVSLVDFELDPLEEASLYEFAEWFDINERKISDTARIARTYLLEQNVAPTASNEDAIAFGNLLGFSNDESLRAFIQFKRRIG